MKPLLLLTVVMCASLAFSQESNAKQAQLVNSITIAADGEYEADPDVAVLQFTLEAQERTYKAAYDKVANAGARIRDALNTSGLDPKLLQIARYSVEPQYEYKAHRYKVTGFKVTAHAKVRTEAMDKLTAALEPIGGIEEAHDQTFTYDLKDRDAAKEKAIAQAAQRAKAYANELASTTGRELGPLHYGSIDVREDLAARMRPYAFAATEVVEVTAGGGSSGPPPPPPPPQILGAEKITITAHVNCIFTLK